MKALVLEIREDKAAILTSEGQIIKVNDKQYRVGQEITIKGPGEMIVDITRYLRRWGTAIAAALLLLAFLGGSYVSLKPYGVVSLDADPSIEFTINRFDRVLYINGVNDGGKIIAARIDAERLLYRNIEDVIDITIDTLKAEGYLKEEKNNYVVVAANTVKVDHTDKLVVKLDRSIIGKENVEPITMKASDNELMKAREMGTTAGKMMIVEKLDNTSRGSINKSNWVNESVASIIRECEKNNAATLAVSTVKSKNTTKPAVTASNTSTVEKTANNSGRSVESSKMTGYAQQPVQPSAPGTQRPASSSKTPASDKSKDSSEPAAKAPVPEIAPVDETDPEITAVGSSSESTSADVTTSVPVTPPVPTAPAVTPVPEACPVAEPVAVMPVATVVPTAPEAPVVQPAVPEDSLQQPADTPADPADPQPSEPSQSSDISVPSQPSVGPSDPSASSEQAAQDSSDGASNDQVQTLHQEISGQDVQSTGDDQGE